MRHTGNILLKAFGISFTFFYLTLAIIGIELLRSLLAHGFFRLCLLHRSGTVGGVKPQPTPGDERINSSRRHYEQSYIYTAVLMRRGVVV